MWGNFGLKLQNCPKLPRISKLDFIVIQMSRVNVTAKSCSVKFRRYCGNMYGSHLFFHTLTVLHQFKASSPPSKIKELTTNNSTHMKLHFRCSMTRKTIHKAPNKTFRFTANFWRSVSELEGLSLLIQLTSSFPLIQTSFSRHGHRYSLIFNSLWNPQTS